MRVALLLAGGTAACTTEGGQARLGAVDPSLVAAMAAAQELGLQLDVSRPLSQLSEDACPADWLTLVEAARAAAQSAQAVVVVHGTDTMAYSAAALALMTADLSVPVVLTGASLPADQAGSDLSANLYQALAAARQLRVGTWLAFGGALHRGGRAHKDLARPESFITVGGAPAAWWDGQAWRGSLDTDLKPKSWPLEFETRVLVLRLYPGLPLRELLPLARSMRGVIVELYASGAAPSARPSYSLPDWVSELGSTLVALTRPGPQSDLEYPSRAALLGCGAIDLGDMSTECATVKLMWALAQGESVTRAAHCLQTPVCEELSPGPPSRCRCARVFWRPAAPMWLFGLY